MGKCKDEMIKLINGEVEKVYIISEFETHYDISKSLQVWKYDKEKDILSYSIVTKNNIKRPYFIKIKNGMVNCFKKRSKKNWGENIKSC